MASICNPDVFRLIHNLIFELCLVLIPCDKQYMCNYIFSMFVVMQASYMWDHIGSSMKMMFSELHNEQKIQERFQCQIKIEIGIRN